MSAPPTYTSGNDPGGDPAQPDRRSRRRSTAAVAATVAIVLTLAIAALVLASRADDAGEIAPVDRAALLDWWTAAEPHVADLQDAVGDSQRALQRMDGPVLAAACQRMHDAAAVAIPAHLPAPDRDVSAELSAATEDAHAAAHMCLSALGRSPNNYDIEFVSDLDQAGRHLRAAQEIVNRILTGQSGSGA